MGIHVGRLEFRHLHMLNPPCSDPQADAYTEMIIAESLFENVAQFLKR